MTGAPIRLTVVLTHPVQYFAPWFRQMEADEPRLRLEVLYVIEPSPSAQGVGFGQAFAWDVPLRDGYASRVLRSVHEGDSISSDRFLGLDAPGIGDAIAATDPDVVLLMGWHSASQVRALLWCRRHGVPVLYRGDTNLLGGPSGWRRAVWRLRTRMLLGLFDGHLAVGVRAREYLLRNGVAPTTIHRSPHCVDNAFFATQAAPLQGDAARRSARREVGLPEDAWVLLFVGKLDQRKRPLDVVEAAAAIGAAVAYVGDGPLRAECEAAARRLGVPAAFAGFRNQTQLPPWYALADCIVLPSDPGETWGLVVNEAMACGLPAIVSHRVGCAGDLIIEGRTGAVVPPRDPAAIAAAAAALRDRVRAGEPIGAACRARVGRHSFAAATGGVLAGATNLAQRHPRPGRGRRWPVRVMALQGQMAILGGLERMQLEVLRVVRDRGGSVHAIVNTWASAPDGGPDHPIGGPVLDLGGSVSTGWYRAALTRRATLGARAAMAWDVLATSAALLRDAWRWRPTHLLLAEFGTHLRNWPAIAVLRLLGVRVVQRTGNAIPDTPFYQALWRRWIAPQTDAVWANSEAVAASVRSAGTPAARLRVIPNHFYRAPLAHQPPRVPGRVIFVGQVIPEKGLDLLLDAVARLVADGIACTLDVAGRVDGWQSPAYGDFRERCLARAAAPDLAGRVRFLGHLDDPLPALAAATVHACPSRPSMLEGMPGVVIEAKMVGTPSVAFAHGPFPELIDPGRDGWLAPTVDAAALAEALRVPLADAEVASRAGAAARASAAAYSRERFDAAILAALEAVP